MLSYDLYICIFRKSRVHIWEWAVGYINSTESRVSTETRLINGIECLVWRWLPSSAANSNGRNRDALWQGSGAIISIVYNYMDVCF